MSQRFDLDSEKEYEITCEDLSTEEFQSLKEMLKGIPSLRKHSSDRERILVKTSEDVTSLEDMKRSLNNRLSRAISEGQLDIAYDKISIREVEKEGNSSDTSPSYEVTEREDVWEEIEDASRKLPFEMGTGRDLEGEEVYRGFIFESEASEYILERLSENYEIAAEEAEEIEEKKEHFREEIDKSVDGSEMEAIWKELLEEYEEKDDPRHEVEHEIKELTREHRRLEEVRSQINSSFSLLEGETFPVGFEELGKTNRVIIPSTDTVESSILDHAIESELSRYTEERVRGENFSAYEVSAGKDVIYQSLRKVSEKLGVELDYGFIEE